jgi:hypothetical protein
MFSRTDAQTALVSTKERWDFPEEGRVELGDGTTVLQVLSAELVVFGHLGNGHPLVAAAFSARVQTQGWEGRDVSAEVVFWGAGGARLWTWNIEGLIVNVETAPYPLGSIQVLGQGVWSQFEAVTYDVGGGQWVPVSAGGE